MGSTSAKCLLILLAVVVLVSCGGGSAAPSSVSPDPDSSLQTVTPALDASVPSSTVHSLVRVISPSGSGPLGVPLTVPSLAEGEETLLLAVDGNDAILLASVSRPDMAILSTDSTALAISRIAMGAVPQSASAADVNARIRSARGYAALVSAIEASLVAGVSPFAASSVINATHSVLGEIASEGIQLARDRRRAEAIVSPVVDSERIPYKFLGDLLSVSIVGDNDAGGIYVTNSYPIQWSISSEDAQTGAQIRDSSSSSDGNVQLPAYRLGLFSIPGSPEKVSIPGNGNAFNVSLKQTLSSRSANMLLITKGIVSLSLTYSGIIKAPSSATCVESLAAFAFSASGLDKMTSDITASAAIESLGSAFSFQNLPKFVSAAVNCVSEAQAGPLTLFLDVLIKAVTKNVYYQVPVIAIKGGYLAAQIVATYNYWDMEPIPLGICESNTVLVDCPVQYVPSPEQFPYPVKSYGDFHGQTTDTDGKVTPIQGTWERILYFGSPLDYALRLVFGVSAEDILTETDDKFPVKTGSASIHEQIFDNLVSISTLGEGTVVITQTGTNTEPASDFPCSPSNDCVLYDKISYVSTTKFNAKTGVFDLSTTTNRSKSYTDPNSGAIVQLNEYDHGSTSGSWKLVSTPVAPRR